MGLVQQCARPMVVHNKIIEKELEAVEGTQYVTKESILRRAQEIKGIPLRDCYRRELVWLHAQLRV